MQRVGTEYCVFRPIANADSTAEHLEKLNIELDKDELVLEVAGR